MGEFSKPLPISLTVQHSSSRLKLALRAVPHEPTSEQVDYRPQAKL